MNKVFKLGALIGGLFFTYLVWLPNLFMNLDRSFIERGGTIKLSVLKDNQTEQGIVYIMPTNSNHQKQIFDFHKQPINEMPSDNLKVFVVANSGTSSIITETAAGVMAVPASDDTYYTIIPRVINKNYFTEVVESKQDIRKLINKDYEIKS